MARLTLEDFLQLGKEQKYSCQYLYGYILRSLSICHALNIPVNAPCPTTDESVQQLDIKDDNSLTLGYDRHFPLLLEFLKNEQVPINSMGLTGLNWFNVRSRASFRSALSSFPHISILSLTYVACTKYDIKALVSSMPTLIQLMFEDNQVEEYDAEVVHIPRRRSNISVGEIQSELQGPELSRFSVTFNQGEFAILELFTGYDSPASLRALDKLEIHGGKPSVVCDDAMVNRIRAFFSLLEFPLDDFICGHFKIESHCPLNLGNVKSVGITIGLSNNSVETDAAVEWWTTNINTIPTANRLKALTIELEIDMDSLSSGSMPEWNLEVWAAFDQALCRRDINLRRLVFRVRPLWELPSEGYNYEPVMYWLCRHGLPKSQRMYRTVFSLFDGLDKKVTMPWMTDE
ncbi:uncharacterized protein BT62DRAFT_1079443 [Guyanagaster necrorhizus]|uniref:Uncharacterized protein n=1 Tax=Guyanagaster necrorhizus TaxID=856835 RepID=A0A9P8ANW2_9AGAR|nr:uncharacterized protein BT62DRAFT_1079443 [Guyanagaster necrorhizus MCA 3950]KAG7442340.1 hypothetical protein BT62DRAFT_1079443 [Guyanagaster necrorhizus MCA 3950]